MSTDWAKKLEDAEAQLAAAMKRPQSVSYKDRSETQRPLSEIQAHVDYCRARLQEHQGEDGFGGSFVTDFVGS